MVACSTKLLKFQAGATFNEPSTVNVINFQVVVKSKGLVGSSYSTAVEFRTTITGRLMGNQANKYLEAVLPFRVHIAANDWLRREMKTELCGVLHGHELSQATNSFELTIVL